MTSFFALLNANWFELAMACVPLALGIWPGEQLRRIYTDGLPDLGSNDIDRLCSNIDYLATFGVLTAFSFKLLLTLWLNEVPPTSMGGIGFATIVLIGGYLSYGLWSTGTRGFFEMTTRAHGFWGMWLFKLLPIAIVVCDIAVSDLKQGRTTTKDMPQININASPIQSS